MSSRSGHQGSDARDEGFLAFCGIYSRAAGAFAILVGALTLLGWFFNVRFLLWTSPGRIAMKANAALGFVLAGLSLWLIGRNSERWGRRVACACAVLVALLGLVTLLEYAGWPIDIDALLVREPPGALKTSSPGRMAPNAALNFALLGVSLVLLCLRRGYWPASLMAFLAGSVGLLGTLAYAYVDDPQVGPTAYTHIALQTAAAFVVLSAGVILATADRGPAAAISGNRVGSVMARRVLPAVLVIPLLLEWLRHEGEHRAHFSDEFGVALMVVASMMSLAVIVWRSAVGLNRVDVERIRAEKSLEEQGEELRQTTEILENIFANLHFMVVYMDREFNFIRVNAAYAAATGHPPGFFAGKNHFDLFPNAENEAIFRRAVETGEPYSVVAKPFRYADQPERDVTYWDWSVQPVKEPDRTVSGLVFCLRDVSDTVRFERQLRESERSLELAVDAADLGLWNWDVASGKVVFDAHWSRMVGYSSSQSEFSVDAVRRLVHPEDLPRVVSLVFDHLRGRTPNYQAEFRIRGKSGEWRWIQTRGRVFDRGEDGRPSRATGIYQDVTKDKDLELAVMRQEKMAILGQLAAGIAHEIRNPLSGLNIYLAAAENLAPNVEAADPASREKLMHALGTARAASVRIEGVIRRVMDFVKPSQTRRGLVTVNDLVTDSVAMASPTLRKSGVRVALALAEGLPQCRVDSRLIEQLILNLLTNASQALETQSREKTIEVVTGREGDAVFIAVGDSGPGVPQALREKIFDPFFTTKAAGTGLGLSICRRIASEHGGSLRVGPSPLGGSEFRVVLPVDDEVTAGSPPPAEPA